jgi:hypothetical protein
MRNRPRIALTSAHTHKPSYNTFYCNSSKQQKLLISKTKYKKFKFYQLPSITVALEDFKKNSANLLQALIIFHQLPTFKPITHKLRKTSGFEKFYNFCNFTIFFYTNPVHKTFILNTGKGKYNREQINFQFYFHLIFQGCVSHRNTVPQFLWRELYLG